MSDATNKETTAHGKQDRQPPIATLEQYTALIASLTEGIALSGSTTTAVDAAALYEQARSCLEGYLRPRYRRFWLLCWLNVEQLNRRQAIVFLCALIVCDCHPPSDVTDLSSFEGTDEFAPEPAPAERWAVLLKIVSRLLLLFVDSPPHSPPLSVDTRALSRMVAACSEEAEDVPAEIVQNLQDLSHFSPSVEDGLKLCDVSPSAGVACLLRHAWTFAQTHCVVEDGADLLVKRAFELSNKFCGWVWCST